MEGIKLFVFVLIGLLIFERAGVAKNINESLKKESNKKLIHLLNDLEILAEYHEKDSPYRVRVIRIRDHGECEAPYTECLNDMLYVAVSSYDEDPDENLFILPKAYTWEFVKWVNVRISEGPDQYFTFEIKMISPPNLVKEKSLNEKVFEIGVNPTKGYIK